MDRKSREHCWTIRDQFHQCLERTNNNDKQCIAELTRYLKACPKSWVSPRLTSQVDHFETKRKQQRQFQALNS